MGLGKEIGKAIDDAAKKGAKKAGENVNIKPDSIDTGKLPELEAPKIDSPNHPIVEGFNREGINVSELAPTIASAIEKNPDADTSGVMRAALEIDPYKVVDETVNLKIKLSDITASNGNFNSRFSRMVNSPLKNMSDEINKAIFKTEDAVEVSKISSALNGVNFNDKNAIDNAFKEYTGNDIDDIQRHALVSNQKFFQTRVHHRNEVVSKPLKSGEMLNNVKKVHDVSIDSGNYYQPNVIKKTLERTLDNMANSTSIDYGIKSVDSYDFAKHNKHKIKPSDIDISPYDIDALFSALSMVDNDTKQGIRQSVVDTAEDFGIETSPEYVEKIADAKQSLREFDHNIIKEQDEELSRLSDEMEQLNNKKEELIRNDIRENGSAVHSSKTTKEIEKINKEAESIQDKASKRFRENFDSPKEFKERFDNMITAVDGREGSIQVKISNNSTHNLASTNRQVLESAVLSFVRGNNKVKNVSVYEASGVRLMFDSRTVPLSVARDILGTDVFQAGTKSLDIEKLTHYLNLFINDAGAMKHGMGNMMLSNRQAAYLVKTSAEKIQKSFNEYIAKGEQELAVKALEDGISLMYRRGSRYAMDTFISNAKLPKAKKYEMGININGVKYNRHLYNALSKAYTHVSRVPFGSNQYLRLFMNTMYSHALGGIGRAAMANLSEPLALIQVAGVGAKEMGQTLKAINPKEYRRIMSEYGPALGLGKKFLDQIINDPSATNSIVKALNRGLDLTTAPFDLTQKISIAAAVAVFEKQGMNQGLRGAELTSHVVNMTSRFAIGNDILSTTQFSQLPIIKDSGLVMFFNFTLRDLNRILDASRFNADKDGSGMLVNTLKFGGAKLMAYASMGVFGYTLYEALDINPFGLFDPYEHLNEEEKNLLDKILTRVPFPYILSPVINTYWRIREAQIVRDPNPQDDKKPDQRDLLETVDDMNKISKLVFGFFSDFVPAGLFLDRQMKNIEAWDSGVVLSNNGYKKFDTDMDFWNMFVAFIGGQGATDAGRIYRGQTSPQRLLGGLLGSIAENKKDNIGVELAKLRNDPLARLFLESLDGVNIHLDGDVIEAAKRQGMKFPEWRDLLVGREPGLSFEGNDLDYKRWKQEIIRLTDEHERFVSIYKDKMKTINSTSEYVSDIDKENAKKDLDEIKKDYEGKIVSLVKGWKDNNHEFTDRERNQIVPLLSYGDDGLSDDYKRGQERYEALKLPTTEKSKDIRELRNYEKRGRELAETLDKKLVDNKDLKEAKRKMYDEKQKIWNKGELDQSDWDKLYQLEEGYAKKVDKVLGPILAKNGGTSLLEHRDVIEKIAKVVVPPRQDWTSATKVSKRGKVYETRLSTRTFPLATVDVPEWVRKRYDYNTTSGDPYPNRTDRRTVSELHNIREVARRDGSAARIKAQKLLSEIRRGDKYANSSDYDYIKKIAGE